MEEAPSSALVAYSRLLHKILGRKWTVVICSLGLLVGSACLVPFIGAEFMPGAEGRTFNIQVRLNEGTRLERTASTVAGIEDLVYSITGDSLCMIYSHIGSGGSSGNDIYSGENTAHMRVTVPEGAEYSPEWLMEKLYALTGGIDGLELAFTQEKNTLNALMGTEDAPVVIEIKGEELDQIAELTQIVRERVQGIKGLFNVDSSTEDGAPEMILTVNRETASLNNLNVSSIISAVQQQLSGINAGQMDYKGEMRDIVIKQPEVRPSELGDMVITSGGQQFRLTELVTIGYDVAPKEIYRRGQNRIAKVTANLEEGYSLSQVASVIRQAVADIDLPADYSITVTGEEEKRQESMDGLMMALALSIILVYMVMASQFESLLHPFTILLTIPLALVGAILAFFVTGTTINIMGVIGVIMLAGIAVNNSIILVDRIGQIKEGYERLEDAVVEAASQRVRPILMTTLTTILSLLPMAIAFGEGAGLRAPMAIAVIGGLVTSTLMSLIVIPCVYCLLESARKIKN